MKVIVALLLIDIVASFCYWRNLSGKLQPLGGDLSQEQIDALAARLKAPNDALEERLNQPK